MIKLKLRDAGPPLTLEQVNMFEREIGGRIPDDYKTFLLANNGGFPDPPVGFNWKGQVLEVTGFDSLLPSPLGGLRGNLLRLRELGMDGFLTVSGSLWKNIYLSFREPVGGLYIRTGSTVDKHGEEVGLLMEPLASSFSAFLHSLTEIPVSYCRVEELGSKGGAEDLTQYLAQGQDLNAVSKNGMTIICEAIKSNNLPMIHACIKHGARLSETIHVAIANDEPELIKLLVKAGADVNERDHFGDTPISTIGGTALPGARGALNRELRELLIKLGATEE